MSRRRSSSQPSQRENTSADNNGDDDNDTNIMTHDMTTLCQPLEELDLSISSYSDTRPISTKVLHEGEDDKPTITLTTYKELLPTPQSLVRLFEPTNPSSPLTHADNDSTIELLTSAFEDTSVLAQHETAELKRELEDHFQGLRSEFEEKTGRAWAPLQPWARDAWEWDNSAEEEEEVGEDEHGMLEWVGILHEN
jgi:hypothetical protein